jgi:PAS domain S-box-containing protein
LIYGGAAVLLMILLSTAWVRNTRGLKGLETAAAEWSEGKLNYRAPVSGDDEISSLGRALNRMAIAAEEREIRLISLLEAAPDAIVSTDTEARIMTWNPGATRLFGYRPDQMIGKSANLLMPRHLRRTQRHLLLEALTGGNRKLTERAVEIQMQRADKREIPVEVAAASWTLNGETYYSAIMRDVTERRAVERLKDRFVSNVSHELRTPMNGVIGLSELLLQTTLEERQRGYVEAIRQSGESLLTVINDILDLSKIEAGKVDLPLSQFDLRDLVEDVAALLGPQAERKGLELVTDIAPELWRELSGPVDRLRQVLLNLAGNAVKFTDQGTVRLHASVAQEEDDGRLMVCLEVLDTGAGLAEEDRERLFQPFSQVDGSLSRRHAGTGLGLVICKRLVGLMGGEIDFESEVGQGTRFWFTTPLAPASPVMGTSPEGSLGQALVVEDAEASGQALANALKGIGYSPRLVTSAQLETGLTEGLRLVVVGGSGEALSAVRTWTHAQATAPRVLVTSSESASVDAELSGPETVLQRPVRISQLQEAVGAQAVRAAQAQVVATGPSLANRGRLLLVEDNAVNRLVAGQMVKGLGLEVDTAVNGREGAVAASNGEYVAILMDCHMPEMDGFEATKAIREHEAATGRPRVPIIALTADAMQGDREKCLAAGMDDYLPKPVHLESLRKALETWVAGPATEEPVQSTEKRPIKGTEVLNLAAIDSARRLQAPDQPNMIRLLVELFNTEAPGLMRQASSAVAGNDGPGYHRLMHRLRGSAGAVGARELVALTEMAELKSNQGDVKAAFSLLPDLEAALDRASAALILVAAAEVDRSVV